MMRGVFACRWEWISMRAAVDLLTGAEMYVDDARECVRVDGLVSGCAEDADVVQGGAADGVDLSGDLAEHRWAGE